MHVKQVFFFTLFSVWLLVLMTGALLTGFGINETYLLRPLPNAPVISFTITQGSSLKTIAANLEAHQLVSSEHLFEFYIRLKHLDRYLLPGTYPITLGASVKNIATLFTTPGAGERSITTIEGWGLREVVPYLAHEDISFDQSKVASLIGWNPDGMGSPTTPAIDFSSEYLFLGVKPKGASLEGFLFPDTYQITDSEDAETLVHTMLGNFGTRVGFISYDDLILASIVEREVATDTDRRLVADIFKRRLAVGMPLQADSTVNYITGKRTASISIRDAVLLSPYNTYQVKGLPPTPISNPGLAAIDAVRHPQSNDFWYFLTDANGGVHYAKTFADHGTNRIRYLGFDK